MQISHQSPSSLPLLNGPFVASCQGGGLQKYVTQAGHIAAELRVHAGLQATTGVTGRQGVCITPKLLTTTVASSEESAPRSDVVLLLLLLLT